MLSMIRAAAIALLASFFAGPAIGQEKDIFNYPAQLKAGKEVKKIVFIADTSPHGPRGNHEFMAGSMLIARTLNAAYPNVYAVVHPHYRWPKDLAHADAVIVALNHGGSAVNPAVQAAMDRGAGFMAIHFGVEVTKGKQGDAFLKWMGGYFETGWSVNPWWVPDFKSIPEHPTTRGVKPFSVRDEWYYHMRFVEDMKNVTPILTAVAPLSTVQKNKSDRGGNQDVFDAVSAGKPQHMAWAYEREGGGRGFGFTGFHSYENLTNDSFRTLLINAAAWVTKLDVPPGGVPSKTPSKEDLETLLDEALRWRK
jgi:hypothetical protein